MRALLRVICPTGDILVTDGPAVTLSDRETGETLRYLPGLILQDSASVYSERYEWLAVDISVQSVGVTVVGPDGLTVQGRAEVSRLDSDSDDHAERSVVVRGELTSIVADTHQWSAVVKDDPQRAPGNLLDDRAVVDSATFPRSDAQRVADGDAAYVSPSPGIDGRIAGAAYPVPIGYPGTRGPLVVAGTIYDGTAIGGPGLLVEVASTPTIPNLSDSTVLVAAGRVDASHVRRISIDSTSGLPIAERLAVRQVHDARGRVVSVVTPGTVAVIDSEQWIAWDRADGGGIQDPYGAGGVLRRVDHVIRWALDRSGARVDWSRMSALSALSHLQIDTVITGQVRALDWLQSEVLGLLPVSVAHGPDGLYIWPWVICDSRDVEMVLRVGEGWKRPDSWQRPETGTPNRVTITYAHDARSGQPTARWTICGHRRVDDDPAQTGLDLYARRSFATWGEKADEMEAHVVCDPSTAQALAWYRLQSACRPQLLGSLYGCRDPRLRPGAKVRVVDHGVDAIAQIEGVRYTGENGAAVDVRVWL